MHISQDVYIWSSSMSTQEPLITSIGGCNFYVCLSKTSVRPSGLNEAGNHTWLIISLLPF